MLLAGASVLNFKSFASIHKADGDDVVHNEVRTLVNDSRIKLSFGNERMILPQGLQPSMLCTRKGTLIVQAQLPKKPYPQQRIFYPWAVTNVVSRDGGNTWQPFPMKEGDNGVNIEGGIIQLKDGTILCLETYVVPGPKPETGAGLLYTSKDDFKTLQGPFDVNISMPDADFYGSTDDGGRPHIAMRFHRRILELPDGDLLATIYGFQKGDTAFSEYAKGMKKSRVMLFRSKDKGRNWDFVSVVASGDVGTEGFGEPVITRVNKGRHAGRLIAFMRTGHELYEAISEDGGNSWSKARPRMFADRDVNKTSEWAEMFKDTRIRGQLITENPAEFIAAVVDPDLICLKSGVLVAAFGIRIPARGAFVNPKHPWNGNYLTFSLDGGETWSEVVQLTSGIWTTHYMAIEETPNKNEVFIAYDFGMWNGKPGRYIYGRPMTVNTKV